MNTHLPKIQHLKKANIQICGSKSESNRLLILKQLYPNINIENLSDSDDTKHLQDALVSNENRIDIGHGGTTMRFLTAFFAATEGKRVTLTGSERMQNRPIKVLVDALQSLGANIEYAGKEGCPPLKISGQKLDKNSVHIDGGVSSQYITALLLIAPKLPNGLELHFKGEITSAPYINMTVSFLKNLGIECSWEGKTIKVLPKNSIEGKTVVVESDWSSASYFFSFVALSENVEIELSSFKKNSLHADAISPEIYQHLGVETMYNDHGIILKNTGNLNSDFFKELDLTDAPDLAQTLAVSCFGLGIECYLTGLHTLKIKETDRLQALKIEIEKLGGEVHITDSTLHLKPCKQIKSDQSIATYNDHRMAMAFAPLSLKIPMFIEDPEVVSKSYPNFWKDYEAITGIDLPVPGI